MSDPVRFTEPMASSVDGHSPSTPAIVVRGLTKTFEEVEAVRGVDFEVAMGEVFGFLGPNGAGKTTTINMLCTLAKPTAGWATVAGHDIVRERDDVRRNIGLVFQDPTLDLGHILSDHVLYVTALNILLSVSTGLPWFLGIPFRAVKAVLLEWYRAAELSCDRAATLAVRDPRIVCRTLMVTAGAMPAEKFNLDAFMAQAMEYESWDDPSDRVRRFFNEIGQTHTYAVRRVSEVMKWVQSGEYDRIVRGEYRTRDQEANVREEAGDAMDYYAERFRTIFREAGDNLTTLGSQVGGAAQQAADWIRKRGGGSGNGER